MSLALLFGIYCAIAAALILGIMVGSLSKEE